jgi:hypothetical protein
MITIAIDASTKSTGIVIFKDKQLTLINNIVNNNKSVLKRIKYMTDEIEKVFHEAEAIANDDKIQIVMEQVIPDNLVDEKWTKNQATFKALFYLQAAIVLMFDHYDLEVELVGASTWRKWCGIKQGGVTRDILKQRDIEFVKQYYHKTVNDDVADAICIGHGKIFHEPEPAAFNWEE